VLIPGGYQIILAEYHSSVKKIKIKTIDFYAGQCPSGWGIPKITGRWCPASWAIISGTPQP
jgi:hypothetical protein